MCSFPHPVAARTGGGPAWLPRLYQKPWVVYCKRPKAGAEQVEALHPFRLTSSSCITSARDCGFVFLLPGLLRTAARGMEGSARYMDSWETGASAYSAGTPARVFGWEPVKYYYSLTCASVSDGVRKPRANAAKRK